jgi:hypothetical protein
VSNDRSFVDPDGTRYQPAIVNHLTGEVVEYKPRSYEGGGSRQTDAERQVQEYEDRLNSQYGEQRELDGAPRYRGYVEYYDP